MAIALTVGRIFITRDNKVQRHWVVNEDETLTWRKRADTIWHIEAHNVVKLKKRCMYSREGNRFYPADHSVTLDDFVFLHDTYTYYHLPTGQSFTAPQINNQIFTSRMYYPVRHWIGKRTKPATFMRKHNRVENSKLFFAVREVLRHAA